MKIKHSKFKNTGILFELLVRQVASDTVSGKDSAAINIIRKYFSKSELAKEHKLYQALVNSKALTEGKAESLINATLEISSRLNRSALRKEKYNLIIQGMKQEEKEDGLIMLEVWLIPGVGIFGKCMKLQWKSLKNAFQNYSQKQVSVFWNYSSYFSSSFGLRSF